MFSQSSCAKPDMLQCPGIAPRCLPDGTPDSSAERHPENNELAGVLRDELMSGI